MDFSTRFPSGKAKLMSYWIIQEDIFISKSYKTVLLIFLFIREIHINTIRSYHRTASSMVMFKRISTPNAYKNVEQLQP